MEPRPELTPRVGTFFILIGIGLMLVFGGSALGNKPSWDLFFLSLIAIFLGSLFHRRTTPESSGGRFRVIHRSRERRKQRQEQKKERESRR